MDPLSCVNCGQLIDEPKTTITIICPKCDHTLLVLSYEDWLEMKRVYEEMSDEHGTDV